MIIHKLTQGTPEWHEHRAKYFNASDAPAMLGCSPYKTREQLLFEKFTGLTPEITAFNQRIFDEGHRFEALARPLAEEIIGDDLQPLVISEGEFSASLDGQGFGCPINWENKTLNQDIKTAFERGEIPKYIRVQVEQQMRIDTACEKTLITAVKFDTDGDLVEMMHQWYTRDDALWNEIIEGRKQFETELLTYQPDPAVNVFSAPAEGAPMVAVQAEGRIIQSNLPVVIEYVEREKANLNNIVFQTDEDYEFAGNKGKEYRELQKCAKHAKAAMLEGTIALGEAVRQLDYIDKLAGEMALHLEKSVKQNKINKQTELIVAGKQDWQKIIADLEQTIKPLKITIPAPDFAESMKGLKSVKSFTSACKKVLEESRKTATAQAQEIGSNLALFSYVRDDYGFLFDDINTIAYKPREEFKVILDGRIANYKAAEAERKAKLEAEAKKQAELAEAARQATVIAAAEKQRLDNERMRLEAEKLQREKDEKHAAELAAAKAKADKLEEEAKQARIDADLQRAKDFNQQAASTETERTPDGTPAWLAESRAKRAQGESHAEMDAQNTAAQQDNQAAVKKTSRGASTATLVRLIQNAWNYSEQDAHEIILLAASEIAEKKAA